MAFAAVDKRDTGVISFKELATVLQHIGEPVSDIELKKMATQCDFERGEDIHYDEFLYMVASICPEEDDKNEVIEALKLISAYDREQALAENMQCDENVENVTECGPSEVFDNGKGYIKADDIRVVMGNLGDRMSSEEIEDMLGEVTIKNGMIKISEFATVLCR